MARRARWRAHRAARPAGKDRAPPDNPTTSGLTRASPTRRPAQPSGPSRTIEERDSRPARAGRAQRCHAPAPGRQARPSPLLRPAACVARDLRMPRGHAGAACGAPAALAGGPGRPGTHGVTGSGPADIARRALAAGTRSAGRGSPLCAAPAPAGALAAAAAGGTRLCALPRRPAWGPGAEDARRARLRARGHHRDRLLRVRRPCRHAGPDPRLPTGLGRDRPARTGTRGRARTRTSSPTRTSTCRPSSRRSRNSAARSTSRATTSARARACFPRAASRAGRSASSSRAATTCS